MTTPTPVTPVSPAVEEQRRFRGVASRIPTGVTVLSTMVGGDPHVVLVNTFTTVSIDPLLALVSLGTGSRSCARVLTSWGFAVTVLAAGQGKAARALADRTRPPTIDGLGPYWPAPHSAAPVFADGVGYFDCTIEQTLVAGDHTVVIAGVRAFDALSDGPALVFVRRQLVPMTILGDPR